MIAKLLRLIRKPRFDSSAKYWERRYRAGGNSGPGSYAHLAAFKAEVLNAFVKEHHVDSVIEFGCGDGNQLALSHYPQYFGYDVSKRSVEICRAKFFHDRTKKFMLVSEHDGSRADLSLSLDVIFHLVEDATFHDYMFRLFAASRRYVGIYSSNYDSAALARSPHVRHRRFSDWIAAHAKGWREISHIPNRFPDDGNNRATSFSEFFFYELEDF